MPRFDNKEEYEKWKADRLESSYKKREQDLEDNSEQRKPELQLNHQQKSTSDFKKEIISSRKMVFAGLFLLAMMTFLYFLFKTDSPEQIFSKNKGAVVFITIYDLLGKSIGQGSGFILAEDGVVATNYHVIKNAAGLQVKTVDDRVLYPEGVLYIDQKNDIALLKLKVKENYKLFKVKIGDPTKLEVGEKVYTIGNPQGLESTFSDGIVSGIREIDNGTKLIQITAPISPGSSGGPVLNKKGRVVGISTFLILGTQNLNFAFPISLIRDVIQTKNIIYTFPKIVTNWEFVKRSQMDDPFYNEIGYVITSNTYDIYYDPDSVVTISGNIKGFWSKVSRSSTQTISIAAMNLSVI